MKTSAMSAEVHGRALGAPKARCVGVLFVGLLAVATLAVPGPAPAVDPDAPPGELACGELVRDEVTDGEEDVFTIAGGEGDMISITLMKDDGISTFTPIFDLTRPMPDTPPIVEGKFGLIDVELPDDGEYTLTVRPRGTTRNVYFLSVEWLHPADKQCSAEEIRFGDTVEGSLGDGVEALYRFTAPAGDAVGLDLSRTDGGVVPTFDLFGPDPRQGVLASGTAGEGLEGFTAPGTGAYTLRVRQNFVIDRSGGFFNLRGSYRLTLSGGGSRPGVAVFVRGDPDAGGTSNITDAVLTLNYLFLGSRGELACRRSADVDANGEVEVTDAIALLGYLFLTGDPPAAPFPDCGEDPAVEPLECSTYPPCA